MGDVMPEPVQDFVDYVTKALPDVQVLAGTNETSHTLSLAWAQVGVVVRWDPGAGDDGTFIVAGRKPDAMGEDAPTIFTGSSSPECAALRAITLLLTGAKLVPTPEFIQACCSAYHNGHRDGFAWDPARREVADDWRKSRTMEVLKARLGLNEPPSPLPTTQAEYDVMVERFRLFRDDTGRWLGRDGRWRADSGIVLGAEDPFRWTGKLPAGSSSGWACRVCGDADVHDRDRDDPTLCGMCGRSQTRDGAQ